MSRPRPLLARAKDERGAVTIIVGLLLVVLLGSAAMLFDLARLRHERHLLQTAVDLGSLAGAGHLPVNDPAGATVAYNAAFNVATTNASQLLTSGLTITFACVVSDPDGDGGDDSVDYELACGPAPGSSWSGAWTSRGGRAIHACDPYAGDLCNTIVLVASSTIEYFFAPVLGFNTGNTGALRAAACKGFCGFASSPLDVVFVIDRTRSMSDQNIADLKDAIADTSSAEDSVLEFYDDDEVHIGMVALPYPHSSNKCAVNSTQSYPNTTPRRWWVSPANSAGSLSSDYRNDDGTLNMGSDLVQKVLCLQRAPSNMSVTPSGAGHTDHGDPIRDAQRMLDEEGRPDVPDVMIFFADGEANQPRFNQPCLYAYNAASTSKGATTSIFSLAYGASGARCGFDTSSSTYGPPPSGGDWATRFLTDIASADAQGNPATDNQPGGCASNENLDGDNYFCEGRGEDLEDVFRQIAIQTIERTRLLNF